MADAATQTYLYGSSAPIPSKANHRMGAAGGGLRDSHLLRGGARETYQRVAGSELAMTQSQSRIG